MGVQYALQQLSPAVLLRAADGGRKLPVLRAEFGDSADTWFYVDPTTGRVLERSTSLNRLYRWLYNGLHSWDFRWLWERRPLWDILVIAFSLGGFGLSVTGVITGVRYLRRDARSRNRGAATAGRRIAQGASQPAG